MGWSGEVVGFALSVGVFDVSCLGPLRMVWVLSVELARLTRDD